MQDIQERVWAVVMAGGGGTRFWPASRQALPKQFLTIGTGEPLLAATVRRLEGLIPPERVLVVTGAAHAGLAREALPAVPAENILAEPIGRNTLPCVAWAAAELERRAPDSIQAVLPADHVIDPPQAFRASLRDAARAAAEAPEALFTLGVQPTEPATGYGYIEQGAQLARTGDHDVFEAQRFVEKPDRATAEGYLAAGRFLWNAGVFVWSTQAIRGALAEHASATWSALRNATPDTLASVYPTLESTSVDVGVMERASDVRVLPIGYSWNDVGSWPALAEVSQADAAGNVTAGGAQLLAEGSGNNIVHAPAGELVALIGVEDLVVVHAGGALLVCPKERAQEVRAIVARLEGEAPDFR